MKNFMLLILLISACADNLSPTTGSTEQKSLVLGSFIFNDLAVGSNDDFEPMNSSASGYYIPSPSGSVLTGLDHNYYNDADGFIIRNASTVGTPLRLVNNSSASLMANRFHFRDDQDIVLEPGDSIFLQRAIDYQSDGYQQIGTQQAPRISAIGSGSRTLGSTFQPSTLRPVLVHYSVTIANTLTLSGGQAGRVELRVGSSSSLSGSDSVGRVDGAFTGTVVIGVSMTNTTGGELSYLVPVGYYVEVVGVNVTGTPTYTLVAQSEETL